MLAMYSTSHTTPHQFVAYQGDRPGCVKCPYPEGHVMHTGRETPVPTVRTIERHAARQRRGTRRTLRA